MGLALPQPIFQDEVERKKYNEIVSSVRSEMQDLQRTFTFVMETPNFKSPEKKNSEILKKDYENCVGKEKKAKPMPREEDYFAKIRRTYSGEMEKPIVMLQESYLKLLNDKQNQEKIVEQVKVYAGKLFNNLKQDNVPEERWGAFRIFINGINNSTIKPEQIIQTLKAEVESTIKHCSSGEINDAPCEDHLHTIQLMGNFMDILKDCPSTPSCNSDRVFECYNRKNFRCGLWFSELGQYWSEPSEPMTSSPEEFCGLMSEWTAIQSTKGNLNLDQKCLDKFLVYAPLDERRNLVRLYDLSQFDVRGRTIKKTETGSSVDNPNADDRGVR